MFYGRYVCRLGKKGQCLVPKDFLATDDGERIRQFFFTAGEVLCVHAEAKEAGFQAKAELSWFGKLKIPAFFMERYRLEPGCELLLNGCGGHFTISKLKYHPIRSPGLKAALEMEGDCISEAEAAEVRCLEIENEPNLTAEELRPFGGLYRLQLNNCGLQDLGFLEGMPHLSHLSLRGNQISSIRPAAGLQHLVSLDISYNPIARLEGLGRLKDLETLAAEGCCLSGLDFVQQFPALKALFVGGNQICYLPALKGNHRLCTLHFAGNWVKDISVLLPLQGLRDVKFSENPIGEEQRQQLLLHAILNGSKISVLREAAYQKKRRAFFAAYAQEMNNDELLELLLCLMCVRQTEEVMFEDDARYTAKASHDPKPLERAVQKVLHMPHSWIKLRIQHWIYLQGAVSVPTVIDYRECVAAGRPGTMRFAPLPGGGFVGPGEHFTLDHSHYTEVDFFGHLMPPVHIGMLCDGDSRKVLWETLHARKWKKLARAYTNLWPIKGFDVQALTPAEVAEIPEENIRKLYHIATGSDNPACAALALGKIHDEFVLGAVADKAAPEISKKAAERIQDETVLVCLALCTRNAAVAKTLLARIKSQKELYTIAMKGRTAAVKEMSVEYISSEGWLKILLKNNRDSQTRKAAAEKITDEQFLRDMTCWDTCPSIQKIAIAKSYDIHLMLRVAKRGKGKEILELARSRIIELAGQINEGKICTAP